MLCRSELPLQGQGGAGAQPLGVAEQADQAGALAAVVAHLAALDLDAVAAREELRRWKGMMAAALPASEEPPYAEFFNGRIRTAIHRQEKEPAAAPPRSVMNSRRLIGFLPAPRGTLAHQGSRAVLRTAAK